MRMSTKQSNVYFDSGEDQYLRLFAEKSQSEQLDEISKLLNQHPTWENLIHFSPQRQLLLNWFTFEPSASLLEIGGGCGALTGLLSERCANVTVVELSEVRAEIIRKRYRDRTNIEVVSSDLSDFSSKKKYNYISLVGVLEYAGVFYGSGSSKYDDSVFLKFLQKCRSLLNENGVMLLAIENQFGLKYLSGAPEDHYGTIFESIQGYPHYNGTRTFGRHHLQELLISAKFTGPIEWYFPFPDYKFPLQIISQELLESEGFPLTNLFPSPSGNITRSFSFNEVTSAQELRRNKLLSDFANSFLAVIYAS